MGHRNRSGSVVALIATLGMTLAFIADPAASAAPVVAKEKVVRAATCATPPDDPAATPENRDRFVSAWADRMDDKGWVEDFVKLDKVPADILAEGFHDLGGPVKVWLSSCLLDDLLDTAGESPSAKKYNSYLSNLMMVIFGKPDIAKMKAQLNATTKPGPDKTVPVKKNQTSDALDDMVDELASEPSLTPEDQPVAEVAVPATKVSKNLAGAASPELQELVSRPPATPVAAPVDLPIPPTLTPDQALALDALTALPLVPDVLQAVDDVLQAVAEVEGTLFTLPVVNLLSPVFYRICAESATMPLSCSISLPVGVPVPADVTGDNLPDIVANLAPLINIFSRDVGARFVVARLFPHSGPLPAHVFAVYDTPFVDKRIEFGYDGRTSTLARHTNTTFRLKHGLTAIAGDIEVGAEVANRDPGETEALTFAVKSLVGGSIGVPATEADPITGAVLFNPFPDEFTLGARMVHDASQDRDVFTVNSATPSRVDATIDQHTTTTTPQSNRRFVATIDQLPTSVTVELEGRGEAQSIDYSAAAPIDLVRASDTAIPDVDAPDSFTESIYEVHGVPDHVHVDLHGAQDIAYSASAKIPQVRFSTRTLVDDELQRQITATAHQVPESVHVSNVTTNADQQVDYTADDELADLQLGMYDRDENGAETNLVATATGIPTELGFTSTKATGAVDLTTNDGIDLIEATLTRNGGPVLPMPGQDHATVHKRGDEIGVDVRLSGFTSAHFDGHEDTEVALGLTPGGQSFDAIADIKDPAPGMDVYATAHVGSLPSSIAVTFDPDNGTADYQASSVIPDLSATFTDRATQMSGSAELTDLPRHIGLTFNTSGETPQVTYAADSRLGAIDLNYSEKPGGLAIHGLIDDLPEYVAIGGLDPVVFDARTAEDDPVGSSHLGSVFFQYATDGVFESPATTDDHVYLNTDLADSTHAELLYRGLRLLTVDTSDQELHAEIRNTRSRILRAELHTPTLDLFGAIDQVPATITLAQVDNRISYDASSGIDRISTVLQRSNGDSLAADLHGVPDEVDVVFDGANSALEWDASAATTGISAIAHLTPESLGGGTRPFDASLEIASIPAQWNASWADGNVLFDAPGPGIGSISARVTNHGAYHPMSGDHLSVYYDATAGSDPGDLDASLRISDLTRASFGKITNGDGGGFTADLDMGDQGTFRFAGDVTLPDTTLNASGRFDHLPSQIHLTSNAGRITYTGNSHADLVMSVEAGTPAAVAALPSLPTRHGIVVRDASAGGGTAYGAKVYLTGLPTGLDLNTPAGTYEVTGYHPTIATLSVDAALTTLTSKPMSLVLDQVVPTATPVDFTFGPFLSSTDAAGNHTLGLNYTANQDLGALQAEVAYGTTDDARLEISEIPKSISVNATFGADQKNVLIAMDHGIDEITASYKKVGATSFAASVNLTDVPSAVDIAIGKDSGSSGGTDVEAPVFTMTTSKAGMDIHAFANAEIADPVDATAAVALTVTNLGKKVTGDLSGRTLHITSSPATAAFTLQAAGAVNKELDLAFSGAGFTNTGQLTVDLDIHEITLGFTSFSDVKAVLDFTTGLSGNFTTFTLGQRSNLTVSVEDKLDFGFDLPDPIGHVALTLVKIPYVSIPLGNVVPRWHVNTNTEGDIFSLPVFSVPLVVDCDVSVTARPAPGWTTGGSTFTLGPPPDDGHSPAAWLLTPDIDLLGLSLPDWGLDIIAFFGSPYGHAIGWDYGCEWFEVF